MEPVHIAGRRIGEGEPVFIAVETGITCNGSLDTALSMIDRAKEAGADAIKFMIIGPDEFMSDRDVTYEYEWADGRRSENMYEMFKGLEFTRDEWVRIRDRCRVRGIIFGVTVDFLGGVDLAESLEVDYYKLSSWDTGNLPLIRKVVATGRPMQVDTGPTTLGDIDELLSKIRDFGDAPMILVHCSHGLTAGEFNLRSVPYLREVFGRPVGYSADSRDHVPDLLAVALGAVLIEKRLTLDKEYKGHHHIKALEPNEFADYVKTIRRAEATLGEFTVKPSAEDLRQKELYFVSIVAQRAIPAGTVIDEPMLACKRPGHGIAPKHLPLLVGRKAKRDIERNELIGWQDV